MKKRQGFVSNSSSSSFIASSKTGKLKFTIEIDLESLSDETLKTEKDVIDYLKENCCWGNENSEPTKEQLAPLLKALEKDGQIFVGSFDSDSEDALVRYLCDNGIPEDAEGGTVIQSTGGY